MKRLWVYHLFIPYFLHIGHSCPSLMTTSFQVGILILSFESNLQISILPAKISIKSLCLISFAGFCFANSCNLFQHSRDFSSSFPSLHFFTQQFPKYQFTMFLFFHYLITPSIQFRNLSALFVINSQDCLLTYFMTS